MLFRSLLKKTQNDNFDLILIQNNNLEAFDNQGKLIQSLKFDNELTPSLKKITKSKSIYYSTITQNGQSILLDGNFKKISAYNFKSTQPPVCEMLNDDGFFYIITINDDLISAYSF